MLSWRGQPWARQPEAPPADIAGQGAARVPRAEIPRPSRTPAAPRSRKRGAREQPVPGVGAQRGTARHRGRPGRAAGRSGRSSCPRPGRSGRGAGQPPGRRAAPAGPGRGRSATPSRTAGKYHRWYRVPSMSSFLSTLQGGEARRSTSSGADRAGRQRRRGSASSSENRPVRPSSRPGPEKVPADHEEKGDRDPGQHPGEPEVGLRGQSGPEGRVWLHTTRNAASRRKRSSTGTSRRGAHGSSLPDGEDEPAACCLRRAASTPPAAPVPGRVAGAGESGHPGGPAVAQPAEPAGTRSQEGRRTPPGSSPCSSISRAWGAPT